MEKCENLSENSDKSLKKSKKHKKKSKKRCKRYSSTSSNDSSSDSSSLDRHRKKSRKKKLKKVKKKNPKKQIIIGPEVPNNLEDVSVKRMAPETKEQWEERQKVIRKVYDEQTGRYRLIKGDGEVLEEIVPKDRHKEINRQATIGDGQYFQSKLPQPKV
ncbi:hypothetical protein O3M35_010805 [Rhynocoris fuscipes]|uniref:ADP-ribosylation factor-like protein 6-interacting protein 4 n=1 Tax=Rhynocoris fuscipes TaxID=488301 RepID=A0AAW1D5T6_9HEMI